MTALNLLRPLSETRARPPTSLKRAKDALFAVQESLARVRRDIARRNVREQFQEETEDRDHVALYADRMLNMGKMRISASGGIMAPEAPADLPKVLMPPSSPAPNNTAEWAPLAHLKRWRPYEGSHLSAHVQIFSDVFCKVMLRYLPQGERGPSLCVSRRFLMAGRWLQSQSGSKQSSNASLRTTVSLPRSTKVVRPSAHSIVSGGLTSAPIERHRPTALGRSVSAPCAKQSISPSKSMALQRASPARRRQPVVNPFEDFLIQQTSVRGQTEDRRFGSHSTGELLSQDQRLLKVYKTSLRFRSIDFVQKQSIQDQQTLFENAKVFHDNNYKVLRKPSPPPSWNGIESVRHLQEQCTAENQRDEQRHQEKHEIASALPMTHGKVVAKMSGKRLGILKGYGKMQAQHCTVCGALAQLAASKEGEMMCMTCLNKEYGKTEKLAGSVNMFRDMFGGAKGMFGKPESPES